MKAMVALNPLISNSFLYRIYNLYIVFQMHISDNYLFYRISFDYYYLILLFILSYCFLSFNINFFNIYYFFNRATNRFDSAGLGSERPDGVSRDDDEFDAYRKRMMLAYRFRPNPLVIILSYI